MKKLDFKGKILPVVFIMALFMAAAVIYSKPVLEGKVIGSGDGVSGRAAVEECRNYTKETGRHSWWTGALFSGMPNYQIGGGQSVTNRIMWPLTKIFHRGHSNQIWTVFFYLIAFFILLRTFGISRWWAAAGAFAIALSSYFLIIIGANHGGKTSSLAWMSVVLAGMMLIYRKKYGLGAVMVMFFLYMGLTPHPQMAYYIMLLMGVIWCAELYIHISEKRMKEWAVATAVFFGSFLIGFGSTYSTTLANKEYMTQTMRGGHSDLTKQDESGDDKSSGSGLKLDYATAWSYGIDETLTFLIPNFKGGSSNYNVGTDSPLFNQMVKAGVQRGSARDFCANTPAYWGDQPFTAGPVYMGAIVCLLFILGLFVVKGPYKWALVVATIFSITLSWGHNFLPLTRLFFNYMPLYDKFRAVSSILVVAEITVPLLGFLALKEIVSGNVPAKTVRKGLWWGAGILGGICLLFALFGKYFCSFTGETDLNFVSQIPDWLYSMIIDQRKAMLVADCWRSILFIALGAVAVLLISSGKLKGWAAAAVVGVLVTVDLWGVDRRYYNDSFFQSPDVFNANFTEQPWETSILADKDPHFRVFNLASGQPFNENRTSYRLKSIGGYNAAKLRRYQDLINEHLGKMHWPVINMLNPKYIIVEQDGNVIPVSNPDAMGNAWIVSDIKRVRGADAECAALMEVDLNECAVVDVIEFGSEADAFVKGGEGEIKLTEYAPDRLEYEYTADGPVTAVFSEIFYPYGWKARIDGQDAPHFRANYALRAMNLPEGSHHITFEFAPDSVKKGDRVALTCLAVMLLTALWAIARGLLMWKKGIKTQE
ncbi:MAG: hypothetical protein HUJ91_00685 [Bacteroidales bacterium]|nr:hypothetical protein [Bacteroidales bacterium]